MFVTALLVCLGCLADRACTLHCLALNWFRIICLELQWQHIVPLLAWQHDRDLYTVYSLQGNCWYLKQIIPSLPTYSQVFVSLKRTVLIPYSSYMCSLICTPDFIVFHNGENGKCTLHLCRIICHGLHHSRKHKQHATTKTCKTCNNSLNSWNNQWASFRWAAPKCTNRD